MKDKLRIALVGCGGMMGAHVNHGHKLLWEKGYRRFEVVACGDVVDELAQKMATSVETWQGKKPKVYLGLDSLLKARRSFDAAVVVVPHREHHRVAVPLLEAKKHVMIEKPLALTLRAGQVILDAAKANGVLLDVAENYRRAPNHRAVNWAIRSGRIGSLRHIHWLDVKERLWYWGWRDELDVAGGGWTLDGGVHYADLMRYHMGPVTKVTALSRQYNTKRYRDRDGKKEEMRATIEDTTMALLEFESGATGIWSESIVAPGEGLGRQIIHGTEGSIDLAGGLRLRGQETSTALQALKEEYLSKVGAEEREKYFPLGLEDSIAQENHEFIEACFDGRPMETDGLEGYRAQAICMAIYESAALGSQPVEMKRIESLEIETYQKVLNGQVGL